MTDHMSARLAIGSVTYAMQARDTLEKSGVPAMIVRLRPDETPTGCAYGINLPRDKLRTATAALSRAGVSYRQIH